MEGRSKQNAPGSHFINPWILLGMHFIYGQLDGIFWKLMNLLLFKKKKMFGRLCCYLEIVVLLVDLELMLLKLFALRRLWQTVEQLIFRFFIGRFCACLAYTEVFILQGTSQWGGGSIFVSAINDKVWLQGRRTEQIDMKAMATWKKLGKPCFASIYQYILT